MLFYLFLVLFYRAFRESFFTMAVIDRELHIDLNSEDSPGLSADNSSFTVNFSEPIQIPAGSFEATVAVEEATIWHTVFNISAALGNNQTYIHENGVDRFFTIPDGIYGTTSLSIALDRGYVLVGGTSGLVVLEPDFATGKVQITVDGTLAGPGGAYVDFTPVDTWREIAGFVSQLVPLAPTITVSVQLAPNEAEFNEIEYYKIHGDIGPGIRSNGRFDQTLARVNITSEPGSQIVYSPFNPTKSPLSHFIGEQISTVLFYLTSHANKPVDTREAWTLRLALRWKQMLDNPLPDPPRIQIPPFHSRKRTRFANDLD